MSLRYKILAAVIGITVLALALALGVILWELIGTRRVFEQFDRALRQRTINGLINHQGDLFHDQSPFIQHEFIRDIVLIRGEEAQGAISFKKGGQQMDEQRARALVRQAILEGRPVVEANEVAIPERTEKPGLAPGGTYVSLDIPEFSPYEPLQKVYVVLLVGIVMIIVVIYVVLSRSVIRPIERLERAAQRVARGDYSRPVPLAGRADEIDTLIEAFNGMMLEIGSFRLDLEARVAEARQKALAAEKNLTIAQRLAATGKLASGIAHEVNNPLAGMLNASRRLKEGLPTPAKHDEYCDLVIEGLQRIQETVKKILQFTPHKVAPQPVALETVLRRALALAAHRVERERVAVEVDLPADARVFGDPFELQQVFLNILLNSLDAIGEAEREGGAIAIRGYIAGTEIRVDVADNGCGMSEDLVSQVFDLFTTTKQVGEGTGLGLSIAHNVIENHGGRIEISSAQGQGTTVSIALPLLDAELR